MGKKYRGQRAKFLFEFLEHNAVQKPTFASGDQTQSLTSRFIDSLNYLLINCYTKYSILYMLVTSAYIIKKMLNKEHITSRFRGNVNC